MLDFGFQETHRTANPERIYYKGYNDQPVLYVSEKTSAPVFFGGAMEATTEADLKRAAALPGAGPIRNTDLPGGGRMVTIRDPDGIPFNVVFGYQRVPEGEPPKSANAYNNAQQQHDEKPRKGRFQRIAKGPSPVYKLGHFGHIAENIAKISAWYMQNFNLRVMDIQGGMKPGEVSGAEHTGRP